VNLLTRKDREPDPFQNSPERRNRLLPIRAQQLSEEQIKLSSPRDELELRKEVRGGIWRRP